MKKLIVILLVLPLFYSCEKESCKQCYSGALCNGIPCYEEVLCGTDKEIEQQAKDGYLVCGDVYDIYTDERKDSTSERSEY